MTLFLRPRRRAGRGRAPWGRRLATGVAPARRGVWRHRMRGSLLAPQRRPEHSYGAGIPFAGLLEALPWRRAGRTGLQKPARPRPVPSLQGCGPP